MGLYNIEEFVDLHNHYTEKYDIIMLLPNYKFWLCQNFDVIYQLFTSFTFLVGKNKRSPRKHSETAVLYTAASFNMPDVLASTEGITHARWFTGHPSRSTWTSRLPLNSLSLSRHHTMSQAGEGTALKKEEWRENRGGSKGGSGGRPPVKFVPPPKKTFK